MPDIKIKRYADKENLKKLMKYSKDTFANKSEINEKFYTKEQIDSKLESVSGGTGGGGTGGTVDLSNYYTKSEINGKFYTREQIDAQSILKRWPDGPEAHNAIWGGRDITAAFDAGTVSEHIADGTFKDIFPGDYITKQVMISGTPYTINWVVADCDYWINKGYEKVVTAHHVAIVPQQPIFSARMNPTNTTEGGYAGSEMYKKIIPACATGIVGAFGSDHILTFNDLIVNEVNTSSISLSNSSWLGVSALSSGQWVDAQCNLIEEHMVYGHSVWSSGGENQMIATRQMSAFRLSEKLINYNRSNWWLRDVVSTERYAIVYAYVYGVGIAGTYYASDEGGVRPFALLS